jgi:rRNA maturation protein Nop10
MIESVYKTLPAPYAVQAISECRNRGARIAIATAEPCPDFNTQKQQRFLDSIGIKPEDIRFCDTCGYYSNDKLCISAGGDMCNPIPNIYKDVAPYNKADTICTGVSKQKMLKEILNGVTDLSKVIFFDDQLVNRKIGDTLGIQTQGASENCNGKSCPDGTGLTRQNFDDGMTKVGGNPEICIFDIDNTLTIGTGASMKKENIHEMSYILTLLILLAITALLMR